MIETKLGSMGIATDLEGFKTTYEVKTEDNVFTYEVEGRFTVGKNEGVFDNTLGEVEFKPEAPEGHKKRFKRDWRVWSEGNLVTYVKRAERRLEGKQTSSNYRYIE